MHSNKVVGTFIGLDLVLGYMRAFPFVEEAGEKKKYHKRSPIYNSFENALDTVLLRGLGRDGYI